LTVAVKAAHHALPPPKSLDASGGSVFLNLRGAAKGALIRAAASTQPLGGYRFTNAAIGYTLCSGILP